MAGWWHNPDIESNISEVFYNKAASTSMILIGWSALFDTKRKKWFVVGNHGYLMCLTSKNHANHQSIKDSFNWNYNTILVWMSNWIMSFSWHGSILAISLLFPFAMCSRRSVSSSALNNWSDSNLSPISYIYFAFNTFSFASTERQHLQIDFLSYQTITHSHLNQHHQVV